MELFRRKIMVETVEWCTGARVRECERGLWVFETKWKRKREQSEKIGELAGQRGDILREKEWWGIKGLVSGAHVSQKSDYLFFLLFLTWLGLGRYTKHHEQLKISGNSTLLTLLNLTIKRMTIYILKKKKKSKKCVFFFSLIIW